MKFYQPLSGQTDCKACPESSARTLYHCNLDASYCIANSVEHCSCVPGTYRQTQLNWYTAQIPDGSFRCAACPTTTLAYTIKGSAKCEGGLTQPYSEENYWALAHNPKKFNKCTGGLCLSGKPECYGDASVRHQLPNSNLRLKPGYPSCDEHHGPNVSHHEAVLSRCEEGNTGIMCSVCEDGRFKYNKACLPCPATVPGIFVYLLAPIFWVFCFFPFIKYMIGQKITPSLFITLPYLQITAILGSFGFEYPAIVKSTSSSLLPVAFASSREADVLTLLTEIDNFRHLGRYVVTLQSRQFR